MYGYGTKFDQFDFGKNGNIYRFKQQTCHFSDQLFFRIDRTSIYLSIYQNNENANLKSLFITWSIIEKINDCDKDPIKNDVLGVLVYL